MRTTDLAEASAMLRRLIAVMRPLVESATSGSADYQGALNDIASRAEIEIEGGTLAEPLGAAFQIAYEAGTGPMALAQVRVGAEAEAPAGEPGKAVRQAIIRLALYWQVAALAQVEIESRDEIEAYRADLNAGFDAAEDEAADAGEAEVYRTLITAHGQAIRDLMERGRTLPRLVGYAFPVSLPAVVIANRLYGDAGRADELIRENRMVHPLFAPAVGRALSN